MHRNLRVFIFFFFLFSFRGDAKKNHESQTRERVQDRGGHGAEAVVDGAAAHDLHRAYIV